MKKKLSFEEGMQALEALVQALESGQMPLEESFQTYERAMNPEAVLNRGYAILRRGDAIVADASQVRVGDAVSIRVAKGALGAAITSVETRESE